MGRIEVSHIPEKHKDAALTACNLAMTYIESSLTSDEIDQNREEWQPFIRKINELRAILESEKIFPDRFE